MYEVTLTDILNARESRVLKQKQLIKKYNCPLVCFTMNIAGPIKVSPGIEKAFYVGIRLLEKKLKNIVFKSIQVKATGCEAFYAVNTCANELKALCTSIEESSRLGRLFDMDVIDTSGTKLERKSQRCCIVCGKEGRFCAAGRLHSVTTLQKTTNNIIVQYFADIEASRVSALATQSLIYEVSATPKPGLVDKNNCGSHKDMDFNMFVKSAKSLTPYFQNCFLIGFKNKKRTYKSTFSILREAGLEAEKTMFKATQGVNTHKGIIYSMGIICAAIGRLWTLENPYCLVEEICLVCKKLTRASVKADFSSISDETAGGRLYLCLGLKGIRGEAASGFKSVTDTGIPAFEFALKNHLDLNQAGVYTLLSLISKVHDTNLYHRGGKSGAEYAMNEAKDILNHDLDKISDLAARLDKDFIEKNLSPGGCADLLALTYFLYYVNKRDC